MFDRLKLLINIDKLKEKTVLLIGLGGVGGYAFETLIRSGIGHIILVDNDKIDITNINRQIISNHHNIGKYKTEEFKLRAHQINKECKITIINKFIDETNIDLLFKEKIDFLIDAEDTIKTKKIIIEKCLEKKVKFITSLGMGNRLDASKVVITTLDKTSYDPVAKALRKDLKNKKIPVVFSNEKPLKNKEIGSFAPLVAVAGSLCTSYVINELLKEDA